MNIFKMYSTLNSSQKLLWTIAGLIVLLLSWAALTDLDKVTRGQGRVIPSSQLQIIQNLEGGIVSEILVKVGDAVAVGDVLVRLDQTRFSSELQTNQILYTTLVARAARLTAESTDATIVFPEGLEVQFPDTVTSEFALYNARKREQEDVLFLLDARLSQRRQELLETQTASKSALRTAELAIEEIDILRPLVEQGIEPRLEMIRAQQRREEAVSLSERSQLAIGRLQDAVREIEREKTAMRSRFRAESMQALADTRGELAEIGGVIPTMEDRVGRTDVRSPVDGVVNQIHVSTLGGVIQPGSPIVEVVPVDETLLIEAYVKPEDIAFLYPGQAARVKLTAYDFAVYGSLAGHVETISAAAVPMDEEGNSAYLVRVRTEKASLENGDQALPILPGMVAEVDILSGKRSILAYLLRPINRVRERAFQEH